MALAQKHKRLIYHNPPDPALKAATAFVLVQVGQYFVEGFHQDILGIFRRLDIALANPVHDR